MGKKTVKRRVLLFVSLIFLYAIIIIGTTYAYMSVDATNSIATGQGGCFEVSYTGQNLDAGNILATTNYLEGAHTTITLSKDASCKIYTEANIYLHTNDTTTAPIETVPALKYKLLSGSTQISEGIISAKGDSLLTKVPLTTTATTYTIYLWIDPTLSNGTYNDKNYSGYIYAETAQTSTVENSHLVSFDTDGGNKIPDQIAITGNTYGNLPTPTREGYTFKGWNGKNLLNYNDLTTAAQNVDIHVDTNGYISDNTSTTDSRYWDNFNQNNWKMILPAGTYTLKINFLQKSTNQTYSGYRIIEENGNIINDFISLYNKQNETATFTLNEITNIGIMVKAYDGIYRIQLEKGSTSSDWEPYTLSNSTTVTQTKNHTLSAIWEPKTYTVTLNANGGTVSPSTMQVTYNNPYGNLPIPTRSGYKFKGWNGKNIFPDGDLVHSTKWEPNQNVTVTKAGDYVQVIYNQDQSTPGYIYQQANTIFEQNKTYTVSVSAKGIGTSKLCLGVYGTTVASWNNLSNDNFKRLSSTFTFTSETQAWILFFENLYIATNPIGTGFQIKDMQVEEGSTATEYEPYILASTTNVTQAKNHTLTAIWEQN